MRAVLPAILSAMLVLPALPSATTPSAAVTATPTAVPAVPVFAADQVLPAIEPMTRVQPGPNVPEMGQVDSPLVRVKRGAMQRLQVRAAPDAAVVWRALDGGVFANGVNYATVLAGQDGIAHIDWIATADVIGRAVIVATSASASGTARIDIVVE